MTSAVRERRPRRSGGVHGDGDGREDPGRAPSGGVVVDPSRPANGRRRGDASSPGRPAGGTERKEGGAAGGGEDGHPLRYLTALLIAAAFLFLNEPSRFDDDDPGGGGAVRHNLRNFQTLAARGTGGYISTANLSTFTVDILSVGSVDQLDLLRAQRCALASHVSVRNFFNVTEDDDADPHCHRNITWGHVHNASAFCRNRRGKEMNELRKYFTGQYARSQWLAKKKSPTGWLCAQPRPYAGLMKAYTHYKSTGEPLPHYFLIMDDDTYYNMEAFAKNYEGLDPNEDVFVAGCLVRPPIHITNFTFPFGGFGSVLSRGALYKLFRGINCRGWINDAYAAEDSPECGRLREDLMWELRHFRNGMSLVELMYRYATAERYGDVDRWTTGFCMHSDWVIGYFVNYYNVSRHVSDPFYRDVPHARMEGYHGSEIYRAGSGYCRNEAPCRHGVEICHRVTPPWLEEEVEGLREEMPDRFRSIDGGDGDAE